MKKRSGIFTLLLSMILIFCFAVPISADLLELDQVEPAGFEDTTNPYGYKEGDPFPLLVQDELVFFGGSGGSHHTGLKNADSTDALNSFTNNPKSNSSDTSFGVPEGKFSFVQAVAFDADGNGTKNHMFFIGMRYYDNTYHAYGWVVDMASSDRKVLATYDIGNMSWVGDYYPQYASTSLFSITAGDYNGDKAETVVVSVPLNYNSEDYSGVELCEFKFDTANSTLSLLSISQRNLMSNRIYDPIDKSYSIDTGRNKLAVSLVTGDFGGDFIDDLAVLSYHHMMTESDMDIAYYDPVIYVVHGRTNGNYIVDGYADRIEYLQAKSGSTITFPMACTLVAGDWDNDNDDDLCVVGVTGSASFSGSKVSGNFLIDDKNWYVQRLYCDGYKLIKEGAKKVDANAWFEDGFYISDMIYGRVMAEAFALNGETNPDMLFISGSLFDISGNDVVYKGQSSYFD
ncbi:MAG: hypothetical protein IIY02_07065, partial [Firmicutes bacterium]|nr:hypothetical protein [Bacillota bacterium]